jgi:RNA polymerase sigma factor (sigma-70 family)
MSPLALRRYRADRLLRAEFERLRASVLAGVSARLRVVGVRLDGSDLDACYAQAWQGLYASVLDGEQIADPEAWLARVVYRRAIDEHRARGRLKRLVPRVGSDAPPAGHGRQAADGTLAGITYAAQRDLAEQLDDRARLRQVFEALRARLSVREREAATLCYLQGLSRAEAAMRMGVSERRMQKLMDGRGDGSPGVAQKVGALVATIDAGRWCEEQGSLMRGFAYGILAPGGERHRLAEAHRAECPACRAYVLSLRGLAAVLPPVPSLLHLLVGPAALGGGAAAGAGAGSTSASGAGSGAAASGGGATAGVVGSGAAAGAFSSGAAGSWWLAGGSLGAKLAVGCVLALGVGAGCVALGGHVAGGPARVRHHAHPARADARSAGLSSSVLDATPTESAASAVTSTRAASAALTARSSSALTPARRAAREFGLEQPAGAGVAQTARVRTASVASTSTIARTAASQSSAKRAGDDVSAATTPRSASAGVPAAQREFAPG